ncbi:MAG: hypothetical protein R3D26_21715 [Cyanobacteriota/Melainabacteria group bacterium]
MKDRQLILNEFGNKIIEKLGRKEVIALVKEPARLARQAAKNWIRTMTEYRMQENISMEPIEQ